MSGNDESENLRQALRALVKMLQQWSYLDWNRDGEPCLHAGGYSAHEAAMRVLEQNGLIIITSGVGRGIRGVWTEAARDFGADWDFSRAKAGRAEKLGPPSNETVSGGV